ncbi:hypothetical protein [Stenotrophomonas rhizophila]
MAGKIVKTTFELVEPAMWSLASKLLILSTERKGAKKHKPSVSTFYETGIVNALYEAMLMSPALANQDIRHEMPDKRLPGTKGASKQVDLWLRPHNGGKPTMIEAGDFSVRKVHRDLDKIRKMNPKGQNWFLAFFRTEPQASDPKSYVTKTFKRKNGLSAKKIHQTRVLYHTFNVYKSKGCYETFGLAMFQRK